MNHRETIERAIRDVLASEPHAIALSNKLFRPDGLFNALAKTEEERRSVVQTPLFQEAQRRLSELQRKEAANFAKVVSSIEHSFPGN